MYDAVSDIGPLESHVVDSSEQELAATLHELRRGIETGRFFLAPA